ncbi:MAG: hypothetical protein RIE31_03555 [Alphaproteobacteria bacterium]
MAHETEPVFHEAGPLMFELQYRGGEDRFAGPTFKVHARGPENHWKLVMRFDCTVAGPHWHEVWKDGPEKIMQWTNTDMAEAVKLSTAEIRATLPEKLEKLGWRAEADAARSPDLRRKVSGLCRDFEQLLAD